MFLYLKLHIDRSEFEKAIKAHGERRLAWSLCQKTVWAVQIFLVQFLIIAVLYGGCAYNLVNNEIALKAKEEENMRNDWISEREKVGSNRSVKYFKYSLIEWNHLE